MKLPKDQVSQKYILFEEYPYTHSLVLGALVAAVPSILLGLFYNPIAGMLFVLASVSHWVLDIFMHLPDLPILGFGKDKKIGLGLWNYPKAAFFVEYALYAGQLLLS